MLGVTLLMPFLAEVEDFAGEPSGLELRSMISEEPGMSARRLGKWYMLAVLMTGGVAVVVIEAVAPAVVGKLSPGLAVLEVVSGAVELSRRVRLLEGESGGAVLVLGLDWVVKRSRMDLLECLRFLSAGCGADICIRVTSEVAVMAEVLLLP
jgi:hypothetical protein